MESDPIEFLMESDPIEFLTAAWAQPGIASKWPSISIIKGVRLD